MTTSSGNRWYRNPQVQGLMILALGGPVGLVILAWGDEAVIALGGGASHLLLVYLAGFSSVCIGIASPLILLPGKIAGHALGLSMLLLVISSKPLMVDLQEVAAKRIQEASAQPLSNNGDLRAPE